MTLTQNKLTDFVVNDIHGQPYPLSQHAGQVVLIVNVASRCGFTPQYAQLQQLFADYASRGLVVLGVPCNQFGQQEPGTSDEILNFCQTRYDVQFPLLSKVDVKGPQQAPLFTWLTSKAPGLLGTKSIKWNFTKFLIDRSGENVQRFGPKIPPISLKQQIEQLLINKQN